MKTLPLKDQGALLIGLKEYIQDVLGDTHFQPIGFDRAEAIIAITGNSGLCYVQFPSENCPELKVPLLWKYSAWADSVERNRQSRLRDEKERVLRHIFEENVIRVKRAILRQMFVSDSQAALLAHRFVSKKRNLEIVALGVTLVTTEEEL